MKTRFGYIGLIFCMLLLLVQQAHAMLKEKEPKDPNWIANYDLTTSDGTDYWAAFMTHNGIFVTDPTLKLSIHAVADTTVTIIVEVNGTERGRIELTKDVVQEGFFTFDSGMGFNDVYLPAGSASKSGDFKPQPKGVHIYAADHKTPFSCYAYSEAGTGQGTTRASTMLLPAHLLGEQYYIQTYQTDIHATEFAVVATEGNTNVTITDPEGKVVSGRLKKGEVCMVRSSLAAVGAGDQSVNLSGSRVCADKPVAVFQGNDYVKIAPGSTGSYSGNHVFNQAFPIEQLGTEHYIGITENANYNFYNILATENNTVVTITGDATGQTSVTLNPNEQLEDPFILSSLPGGNKFVKITANNPVMVTHYLTCGGANQEISATGINNWGNPTSATILAWEKRTKKKSFFTQKIQPELDGTCHMYVQVIANAAQTGTFKLDGVAVPSSSFVRYNDKAVANIEIQQTEDVAKHTLETTGGGFVGFVYAINSEARVYEYTMGFTPKPLFDSLYVAETDNIMSQKELKDDILSYNLERTSKGWYQRQIGEWLQPRLDTAIVCDSTEVHWALYTPSEKPIEQLIWSIYDVTGGAKAGPSTKIPDNRVPYTDPDVTSTQHLYKYMFVIDSLLTEDDDKNKPFYEYEIQAVLKRTLEKCDIEELDTFRTVVRVSRMYNDTTWKVICKDSVFTFFNDTTTTGEHKDYTTTFYFESKPAIDELPSYQKHQYHLGENIITRQYISQGGCDSLSTLRFYVCDTKNETLDTTICEDGLVDLRARLGNYYFQNFDFVNSFKNKTSDSRWKRQTDGSWVFEDKSSIKTTSCKDEVTEYIAHKAEYDGCDSTLNLQLRVMPVDVRSKSINICEGSYEWRDDDGNLIQTIVRTAGENYNTPHTYTQPIKYQNCVGCPTDGCDSVRYELKLMFVDAAGSDTVHLCQNADPVAYEHKDDNTGASYTWPTFDPRGKNVGIYSYESQKHLFESPGCNYYFHPVFVVDTVPTYRDSVVYCYEKDKIVYHTWENHGRFWYNKKGETRKQTAASITVDLSTIRTRTIYELTDTIWMPGECPTVYNQAVIFMPNYNSSSRHDMSDEDVYEWDNKLLAGDKATGYDNPKGLDVIVMRPTGASYPTKWTVTYDASLKQYTIVNATQTVAIKNEQGQAQSCDSTATLYLRIGQKFDSTEYAPTCSDAKTYKWRTKDIAVPQGITAPTTITKYDSLKTKHPVVGLDSVYILKLTVYPAFRDTTAETEVCQRRRGYQWAGHMGEGHTLYDGAWNPIDSICIDNVGHYYFIDKMDTKPRTYTDEGTGVSTPVTCDSIWVLDLTVHTVYDSTFTMIGGDTIVLKSNDTVTYFEPKTLFIGEDFDYAAHGGKTAAQLAAETGADKWEIVRKDSMYSKLSTSQYGCDSTTYKFIELCWLKTESLVKVIGDNDTTWTFGGDTVPDAYGVKEHTQPLVTGWDFHKDDDGHPIDYTTDGRPVRTREYVDTLHTEDGCDSIVHMSLTIYPSYRYDTVAVTCHNQKFDWRGMTDLNQLGTDSVTSTVYVPAVYHTVQSGGIVDSIYVLALTIRPGQLRYYHKDICYNETFLFYSIPVTYDPEMSLDTVVAVFRPAGSESCGDIFYLTPTFDPAYGYTGDPNYKAFVDSADVCQYDDFHWYDKNGKEHTVNLRDETGRKYDKVPTDRRGWHTIYDSLKTVSCNCDSIYTLHYFVDTTYQYRTDTAICPEELADFRWIVLDKDGNPYEKDTVYSSDATVPIHIYDTIAGKTVHGCDSSFYLDLFVDQPDTLNFDTTLCNDIKHYEWTGDNGTIVYDPWIELASDTFGAQHFFDTLHTQTVRGKCDSVVYLHLIIAPRKDSVWQDTICTGETYYLYDQPITAGGNYEIVRINEFGCKSTYILELTEVPPTVINLTVEPVCVDEDGMANNYVIRYTYEGKYAPISYSIRYDSIAEMLGFESEEDVVITEEAQLLLPVPEFGTRDDYPRPGYYKAVIAFNNGVCMTDSLMTYPFTLEMRYPSWLTAQHWNDAILIVDSALNGGYIFSAYQWYRNDSILHGETKPYLYEPQYLHAGAQYSVALTRKDDAVTVRTCPIIPDLSNWYDKSPQQNYVSVVPTVVAKENPIVYILSTTGGIYKLMNTQGQLITQGTYTPDDKNTYPVTLPAISGVYVFHLIDNATTGTGGDLSRTVKVMVQ